MASRIRSYASWGLVSVGFWFSKESKADQPSPPMPVYFVEAKVNKVVTAPLGDSTVVMMAAGVVGPSTAVYGAPEHSETVEYAPNGCPRVLLVHQTRNANEVERFRSQYGKMVRGIALPRGRSSSTETCGKTSPGLFPMNKIRVEDIELVRPTNIAKDAKNLGDGFFSFAKAAFTFFEQLPDENGRKFGYTGLGAEYWMVDQSMDGLASINTPASLALALEYRISPVTVENHKHTWLSKDESVKELAKVVSVGEGGYLSLLEWRAPDVALELVKKQPVRLASAVVDIHNREMLDALKNIYPTLPANEQLSLIYSVASVYGPDEYWEPFLIDAARNMPSSNYGVDFQLKAVAKALSTFANRRAEKLDTMSGLFERIKKERVVVRDFAQLLSGMRIHVVGQRDSKHYGPVLFVPIDKERCMVELLLNKTQQKKWDDLVALGVDTIEVEGAIAYASTSSSNAPVILKLAGAEVIGKAAVRNYAPASRTLGCHCEIVNRSHGNHWGPIVLAMLCGVGFFARGQKRDRSV